MVYDPVGNLVSHADDAGTLPDEPGLRLLRTARRRASSTTRGPSGVAQRRSYTPQGFRDRVESALAGGGSEAITYSQYEATGLPGRIVTSEGTTQLHRQRHRRRLAQLRLRPRRPAHAGERRGHRARTVHLRRRRRVAPDHGDHRRVDRRAPARRTGLRVERDSGAGQPRSHARRHDDRDAHCGVHAAAGWLRGSTAGHAGRERRHSARPLRSRLRGASALPARHRARPPPARRPAAAGPCRDDGRRLPRRRGRAARPRPQRRCRAGGDPGGDRLLPHEPPRQQEGRAARGPGEGRFGAARPSPQPRAYARAGSASGCV